MSRWMFVLTLMVLGTAAACAQTVALETSGGRTAESITRREAVPALQRSFAEATLQLTTADARRAGELWLEVSADNAGAAHEHITMRLPLANTGDVYGEERSCKVNADGSFELVFTAGLEEANYVHFAPAAQPKPVRFLLNKYLCRALAAPFRCNGVTVTPGHDWSQWTLGRTSRVLLSSVAPAAARVSAVHVQTSGEAFDPASCAAIAPSSGLCCVGGKTTAWHCGGTPAGEGWHQVSGECFHRETGGSCKYGDTLTLTPGGR